jgi:tungstate transport system permease protein
MVIAQTVLVTPIIAALTRQTVEDLWVEYRDEFAAMEVGPFHRVWALLWDARFSLVTALLAGFGRAAAEVEDIARYKIEGQQLFYPDAGNPGA